MANYTHNFTDYHGAKAAYDERERSSARPLEAGWWRWYRIGHNTYVGRFWQGSEQYYGVRYHNTVVVEYAAPGVIYVNDGGRDSVTTRERLTNFTPASFHRVGGVTHVIDQNGTRPFDGRGRLYQTA